MVAAIFTSMRAWNNKNPVGFVRFLPYLIAAWFRFLPHSLHIDINTYNTHMARDLCDPPSSLSSSDWVLLRATSYEVWHWRYGFIYHSPTGIVMMWVTGREGKKQPDTSLKSLFNTYTGFRNSVLLFTHRGAADAVTDLKDLLRLFIERLPGQVKAFTTLLKRPQGLSEWTHFTVLPLRSNSGNITKQWNEQALKPWQHHKSMNGSVKEMNEFNSFWTYVWV